MAEIRVTGGELRGRRLYVPKSGVRPTTGRVREAIFSMLGSVQGTRVLDLFCGSGALGVEALSRGASEATFVDKKADAVARNLNELGITELDSGWGWRVAAMDVGDFLFRETALGGLRYDLVLCDPPYRLAADFGVDLAALLPRIVDPNARLVLETSFRNPLELTFPVIKEREYGDTLVRVHSVPSEVADR